MFDSLMGYTGIFNLTIRAAGKFYKDIAGDISKAKTAFNFNPKVDFYQFKLEMKRSYVIMKIL